jgi:uncharacterized membrane protein required for colicin V production
MILDALFLIVGGYAFWVGYDRGIINTVFTTLSWFVAFVATLKFAKPAQELVSMVYQGDPSLTYILGLIFAFLFSLVVVRSIGKFFTSVLENANVNLVNQLFGGALSAGFFIMIFSYIVQFTDRAQILTPAVKVESRTWPLLEAFPTYSTSFIRTVTPFVATFWDETLHYIDQIKPGASPIERSENGPQVYDQPLEEEPTPGSE